MYKWFMRPVLRKKRSGFAFFSFSSHENIHRNNNKKKIYSIWVHIFKSSLFIVKYELRTSNPILWKWVIKRWKKFSTRIYSLYEIWSEAHRIFFIQWKIKNIRKLKTNIPFIGKIACQARKQIPCFRKCGACMDVSMYWVFYSSFLWDE